MTHSRTISYIVALLLIAGQASSQLLRGEGASFPKDAMNAWIAGFGTTEISYTGREGAFPLESIAKLKAGTIDFVASDTPIDLGTLGTSFAQIPNVLTGVVICYNLPDLTAPLKLDSDTTAGIFSGRITSWQDTTVKALNPTLTTNTNIEVVSRADPSSTAYELTDLLYNTVSSRSLWPVKSTTLPFNPSFALKTGGNGLATYVKNTPSSIGFCKKRTAETNGLKMGALKNRAGVFVLPTDASINLATTSTLSYAQTNGDWNAINVGTLTTSPDAYVGSRYSFIIVPRYLSSSTKHQLLQRFLLYCASDVGQTVVPTGFIAMSKTLREHYTTRIRQLSVPLISGASTTYTGSLTLVGIASSIALLLW